MITTKSIKPFITIHSLTLSFCCLSLIGCSYLSLFQRSDEEQTFAGELQRVLLRPQNVRQDLLDELLGERPLPVCEGTKCSFVYKGEAGHTVSVAGDWNGWNAGADLLDPVEGTDYYLLTKEFPPDARLDYKFVVDDKRLLDPQNPKTCEREDGPNCVLAMPAYLEPEEQKPRPDIRHGIIEEMAFESEILNGTRAVSIYLPPSYGRASGPHPFLIVQDGGNFIRLARFPDVADVLIEEKKVRRVVIVFVEPENREEDFLRSEAYLRFTVEELIPYLRIHYDIGKSREDCGVLGASLGAVAAFRLAWRYPELIGKMAGLSTCFERDESLTKMVRPLSSKPMQFYLDVGMFETHTPVSRLDRNRKMRSLLLAARHELTYSEHNEGHSWGNWRAHLDDVLMAFWRREPV
ncbi:MAG: alpha/beta hydrolase-fold protein [bacterium]